MKNKIALVTGGIGDIGTAICQSLAKSGHYVVAIDRLSQEEGTKWIEEQKKLGFNMEFSYADISQFSSCEKMLADIEKRIGSEITIVVNNAGINRDAQFRKMTLEQWNAVINIDLDGLFNVTRQVINGMCDRNFGRIINISSVSAQLGQFGQTNYSAAKSGVHGFTKSLAREVAKFGVTVNTISPGFIDTKMILSIPDNIREQIIKQVPVGRLGKPEEIARAVAFLASEHSSFITGSNLSINGGLHMC
ncbi:MAG: acetoacetyl-CoA reductase [Gammaproteobacteria bacterium]